MVYTPRVPWKTFEEVKGFAEQLFESWQSGEIETVKELKDLLEVKKGEVLLRWSQDKKKQLMDEKEQEAKKAIATEG